MLRLVSVNCVVTEFLINCNHTCPKFKLLKHNNIAGNHILFASLDQKQITEISFTTLSIVIRSKPQFGQVTGPTFSVQNSCPKLTTSRLSPVQEMASSSTHTQRRVQTSTGSAR